ncbi:cobyrinate a,c-diamide synthase [Neobacillus thermocopriae]|uniref:cobyrinate a,c-diamide synthase n=1 Tax=Neobacillus thermocopriae TaxID=1215031 RepID=UPI00376F65CF
MQPNNQTPAIIISATHSGAGKTTVTRALLAALKTKGLNVQPFKIGPDFIDPMYHTAIVDKPSVNLDYWMMGEAGIRETFSRWSQKADIAVIEGMGALFDGANGTDEGSAAHIAKILDIPVVVVIDVYGMTRTTAAIMDGVATFDPHMKIAGYILNRCGYIGSEVHKNLIKDAIGVERWNQVLTTICNSPVLEVAERHLGLITTYENTEFDDNCGLNHVAKQMDVDKIFGLELKVNEISKLSFSKPVIRTQSARLAVARDAAFCFYYEENLLALKEAGFEIVEFSPIKGDTLPPDTDALYFGGGYPESFVRELEDNVNLATQLRHAAKLGMPIFGECGGLIYLGRSLTGFDGKTYSMSGVLPVDFVMDSSYLQIRYIELTTRHDSLLGCAGTVIRGQEFHQSRVVSSEILSDFYTAKTSDGREYMDGFHQQNVVASYAHIYLNSCEGAANNFINAARRFQMNRNG